MARKRASDEAEAKGNDALSMNTPKKRAKFADQIDSSPAKTSRWPERTPTKINGVAKSDAQTPQKQTPNIVKIGAKSVYTTPTKTPKKAVDTSTAIAVGNADRSARRKSARNLIERTVAGELSDDELQENVLARRIWEGEGGGEEEEENDGEDSDENDINQEEVPGEEALDPSTPSKRGRGRLKVSKRKRTPTPPPNMAPHEQYFFQNRPSGAKISANTFPSSSILSHSAYHTAISSHKDPHAASIDDLHNIHAENFPLWAFELSQGFSVCLYGYGSKYRLLRSFADHLHSQCPVNPPTTIIINGHHPNLSIRTVLTTLARAIFPSTAKFPPVPSALTTSILTHLTTHPPSSPIYLLLSPLHTRPLTVPPTPTLLSQLAAHPAIHLLATADNPSFPLLHPAPLRAAFNFVFHDATTFAPYDAELGATVVDDVLALMGRRTAGVAGREGVQWVLRSLPENARGLYRVLVSEVLAAADAEMERETGEMEGEGDEGDEGDLLAAKVRRRADVRLPGVDAKILYQKAVEEFLCSSEMMFWNLLKEFMDHRMVVVRRERGPGGGEILGVEMGKEELVGVLEDLVD